MSSWAVFAQQAPDLAQFGLARFQSGVAYLATLRADGSPRVHPVTPIIGAELFLFMEPGSPKAHDLQRDPRYSMHCSVADSDGGAGEFAISGRAFQVHDPVQRELAVQAASYSPLDRYLLFRCTVESVLMTSYEHGQARRQRWKTKD